MVQKYMKILDFQARADKKSHLQQAKDESTERIVIPK